MSPSTPRTGKERLLLVSVAVLVIVFFGAAPVAAQKKSKYVTMAPLDQYLMGQAEEVALARSAAPAPIGREAKVLYFTGKDYVTIAEGSNSFTCLVLRGWTNPAPWTAFWNPQVRVPICYNASAAETILPIKLFRTELVLKGASAEEVETATWEAVKRGHFSPPGDAAMAYMMSSGQYLSDRAKSGVPHVMFYRPYIKNADLGGNRPGAGYPFVLENEGTSLAVVVIPNGTFVDPETDK